MKNLVDKYVADATPESDEGVVAIEYVVVAAAVVAALVGIFGVFGDELADKITDLIAGL
jgi:Flp pilus assembly pilin Flp